MSQSTVTSLYRSALAMLVTVTLALLAYFGTQINSRLDTHEAILREESKAASATAARVEMIERRLFSGE